MTRTPAAPDPRAPSSRAPSSRAPSSRVRTPARPGPRLALALAALALAAWAAPASPARAAGPTLQFANSHLDLPVMTPAQDTATRPADGVPLYERAPMPNENTLAPQYDSGAAADPLQPSVISRGSKATDGGGYSRNSSANAAQESRMKPGLGFAQHVPTE